MWNPTNPRKQTYCKETSLFPVLFSHTMKGDVLRPLLQLCNEQAVAGAQGSLKSSTLNSTETPIEMWPLFGIQYKATAVADHLDLPDGKSGITISQPWSQSGTGVGAELCALLRNEAAEWKCVFQRYLCIPALCLLYLNVILTWKASAVVAEHYKRYLNNFCYDEWPWLSWRHKLNSKWEGKVENIQHFNTRWPFPYLLLNAWF